jgi:hypothetical protein
MRSDPTLSALFKAKLDLRATSLSSGLLKTIHAPSLNKASAVRLANWLQRLDETDKARQAFLGGRAALVKKRVKQIKFEGDIEAYIGELAIVVFTLVKNTCEWYMAAFRDSKLASGASLSRFPTDAVERSHRLRAMGHTAGRALLGHVPAAGPGRGPGAAGHGGLLELDQGARDGGGSSATVHSYRLQMSHS